MLGNVEKLHVCVRNDVFISPGLSSLSELPVFKLGKVVRISKMFSVRKRHFAQENAF